MDPLWMQAVAFNMDDKYGKQLRILFDNDNALNPCLQKISGKNYLFGTVMKQVPTKAGDKSVSYQVHWEDSVLGITSIELQLILQAIDLTKKLTLIYQRVHLLLVHYLTGV